MFTLPHFCRICLKYDKNLIDLAHIENEPNETLLSKLQFCASEVDWSVFKPLLCHPCIKRLNISYGFKKECIQSAGVLKGYIELLKDTQSKNAAQAGSPNSNEPGQSGAYMLLPNQKYLKILVGGQNQNTFQNVFLNLVPNPPALVPSDTPKSKDTNQNIFFNINNTFRKYIPIAPNELKSTSPENSNVNVSQLFTNAKSEELSVEIDPTDFGLSEDNESSSDEKEHDWDEIITHSTINPEAVSISRVPSNKAKNGGQKKDEVYNSYVPILPKQAASKNETEKMEFFNAGQHFLYPTSQSQSNKAEYMCETCQKTFSSKNHLRLHLKTFHMGKMPFKCEFCFVEHMLRSEYDACIKYHKELNEVSGNNSLTLQDFANGTNVSITDSNPPIANEETGEFPCEVCHRIFFSSTGLLRHKVRKHNQTNKKKYFIKGMKNAQCDICKREFSTQSYMQLHRKLHLREDVGYKYKVLSKSKYSSGEGRKSIKKEDEYVEVKSEAMDQDQEVENLDCTPDIFEPETDDEDDMDASYSQDANFSQDQTDDLTDSKINMFDNDIKREPEEPEDDSLNGDCKTEESKHSENSNDAK